MSIKKDRKRHLRAWAFFRPLLSGFIKGKFNFTCDICPEIDGPYIVLSNHNTDWDPLIVAMSFPKQMYYVASEHVARMNALGMWFVKRYFAPIFRIKGSTDAAAAMGIIKAVKSGFNVCIFGEGDRSFNGLTGPIHPATTRLIKRLGVTLVTYRMRGGYQTSPRWGYGIRRGKMLGEISGIYSPEKLKAMTAEELEAAIASDLAENAYDSPMLEGARWKGKNLAKGLEHALYICPSCGKIDSMRTEGSTVSCICGFKAELDDLCRISGGPFSTVTEWDNWQNEKVRESLAAGGPNYSDEGMKLMKLRCHELYPEAEGTLTMDANGFKLGDIRLSAEDISDMSICGRDGLIFTHTGDHYEIKSDRPWCARKYLTVYRMLKGLPMK